MKPKALYDEGRVEAVVQVRGRGSQQKRYEEEKNPRASRSESYDPQNHANGCDIRLWVFDTSLPRTKRTKNCSARGLGKLFNNTPFTG